MAGLTKIPSLIRKAGQAASKAQPFYSNVDEAIANIKQGTGTGAQMLAELLKTKGVAKELKDRPAIKKTLEANKESKVTKTDLERLAAENPAPQVEETVLGGGKLLSQSDLDRLEREAQRTRNWDAYEEAVQRYEAQQLGRGGEEIGENTKFAQYSIPGGENYREVLIRLPEKQKKETWEWFDPDTQESKRGFATQQEAYDSRPNIGSVVSRVEADDSPQNYRSSHWEPPNVLAHARVSDRTGPNGEKILHVEEIQSDWHQAGRDARNNEIKRLMKAEGIDKATANERVPQDFGYAMPETQRIKGVVQPDYYGGYKVVWEDGTFSGGYSKEAAEAKALEGKSNATGGAVPDAPFKQNWHELVMKRLLDDAARNGYDRVVITPGAEQANRYKLSSHIDNLMVGDEYRGARQISWRPVGEMADSALMFDEKGNVTQSMLRGLEGKNISEIFGKDLSEKIMQSQPYQRFEGVDLDVGGEGMKGFYDQILPSYLNDYGKKWGAKVQPYSYSMEGTQNPLHAFDITPQMREEIVGKGQPLYQVVPPAIGSGALMQEEEPGMKRGGAVNADAMSMAVWNKQLRK
jgi:hypothetical protein